MNIPEDGPFVCFHARDASFLKSASPGKKWDYHDYRDSHIENYLPGVEALTRRGYSALRMGSVVETEINTSNPAIIDYATGMRNDFLDVFLSAKCSFFTSSAVGIGSLPIVFRRPVVFVNFISLAHIPASRRLNLIIPKKLWRKKESRFMTFKEILASGTGCFNSSQEYRKHGIEPVENTSEEIRDVCVEMDARLKGQWVATEEDEALQNKFWSLFEPGPLNAVFRARLGTQFLRQNKTLMD